MPTFPSSHEQPGKAAAARRPQLPLDSGAAAKRQQIDDRRVSDVFDIAARP